MDKGLEFLRCCSAIVCSALVLASCEPEQVKRSNEPDPYLTAPTHTSYNITVNFFDSTRTKAVLRSNVARIFEELQQTTLADSVVVDFISKSSGKRLAKLTADSAVIDDRTKNMTAIGNVRVYSDSSRTTLTTEFLVWNSIRERLSSTQAVKIVSPKETINGIGFESDQFLTDYRIYSVSGEHR